MTRGIFITGTDTDAGKTIVSAGIMYLLRSRGYNAVYFKAALSGAIERGGEVIPGDTNLVSRVCDLREDYENITPYIYRTPVSPHLAAKLENNPINMERVIKKYNLLKQRYDYVVVEGSGGIVCPLIDDEGGLYLLEELIKDLKMEIIVVARAGLGTINHTVTTVEYIKSRGIKVKGIIINGYKDEILCRDNLEIIKRLTRIPIVGVFNFIEGLDDENMIDKIRNEAEKAINIDDLIGLMDEI